MAGSNCALRHDQNLMSISRASAHQAVPTDLLSVPYRNDVGAMVNIDPDLRPIDHCVGSSDGCVLRKLVRYDTRVYV